MVVFVGLACVWRTTNFPRISNSPHTGWFEELASGSVRSLAEIARRESIAVRYVERLSRLAFTAPGIVEAICRGRQPAELNAETLLNRIDLPLEWPAQLKAIGID